MTRVPQTRSMQEADLSADDARTTLRHYGRIALVKNSFVRFRYGDGFSHARALGFQLVLSLIPLGIAFIGLSSTVSADTAAQVLREVLLRITPGSTDEVVRQTLEKGQASTGHGEVALWLGLGAALLALTASMGQIERGSNRIYGIQRDRPALRKYGRAALMAVSAGLMSLLGFLVVVSGGIVGDVLARTYDWSDTQQAVWTAARFPVGILLALAAFTLIIERSPRRRQPGWSWIAIGAGVSLTLWVLLTYLLSLYVQTSGTFGSTYGPLTGVMALLIWAQLTSIALFLGIAFCAQLEAVRAGVADPERGDPEGAPVRGAA
ncbi:MAG TPA: YihY/virulence factor BrkB family protein [Actinomycetes bacterium]|nr:YihY/virulence factor BrkB family protein [Actinomycetes bacterium]